MKTETKERSASFPFGEFDAREWAKEFKRLFPDNTPDEGTLLGWFANAIMTGYDFAKNKAESA